MVTDIGDEIGESDIGHNMVKFFNLKWWQF